MFIELPNGKSIETDDPYSLDELFFFVDTTFPDDEGRPCTVFNQSHFDESLLYELGEKLDDALKYVLDGYKLSKDLKRKNSDLFHLIESCTAFAIYHEYDDGEKDLEKDGYVQLNSFIEYLISLAERSDDFLTQTSGEDTDTAPGMSSGYMFFWDYDSKSSGKLLNDNISNDIRLFKQRAYEE